MNNKLMKIFDSIGFNFTIKGNNFVVGQPISGYNSLNSSHIGYYVPYLVRNYTSSKIEYEIGVGYIKLEDTNIVVERYKIIKSSNNDTTVIFSKGEKSEFYVFANESNFNTAFNNIIVQNDNFSMEPVAAIYLVDSTAQTIDAVLPANTSSDNLVVEIKLVGGDNPVIVRDSDGHIVIALNTSTKYTKLAYKDNKWYPLVNDEQPIEFGSLSTENNINFSSLANPVGNIYSFQYNNGSDTFAGANMYWSSGNTNKLLLGADNETAAHSIIPTSGNSNFVLNNLHNNNNFIVHGSGTKNLFFTYDGKLGLNVPTGTGPSTIVHVVNTICSEILRLENRKSCKETTITLYHAPSGTAVTGVVSTINLAGKDSNGNQLNYSQLRSTALNTSAGSTKGQFDIVVAGANTEVKTLQTNTDSTTLGYVNNKLNINNNTNTSTIGNTSNYFEASSTGASIKSANIVLGTGTTGSVTINGTLNTTNNLIANGSIRLPNLTKNSVLTLDNNGNISSSQSNIKFPNVPSGYILTTSENGSVTGVYKTDSYFLTEKDITWNKYPQRRANICLRQISLVSPAPMEELVEGDQIAIVTSGETFYRNITSLDVSNNAVVGMLINQTISTTEDTTNIGIYSVTRGGYLLMQIYTEPGSSPDASSNTLSIRPLTDTVFNSKQKDIDFKVYGLDLIPALSVQSNSGRSLMGYGVYHEYSTGEDSEPFAIPINSSGVGFNNTNNTVNYNLAASGRFTGMVSDVGHNGKPSFYGTYDQNGNVAEWIEDFNRVSTSIVQYAAGGSWNSIGGSGLHSLIPYVFDTGYNNVGFRVCSSDGLIDVANIHSDLKLEFVNVNDPGNIPDPTGLYTSIGDTLTRLPINNLGSVNHIYRIGKYEITNAQYAQFLNAVALFSDVYNLYNDQMDSSDIGGITRTDNGDTYGYEVKEDMGDKPVAFISYLSAIRFCNWLHNGAPTGENALNNGVLESGAYEIISVDVNTYQINKNIYQKYWLPSIHEWHKAAYFEPQALTSTSGTSSVLIKRDSPYTVGSGLDSSNQPYVDYANLSVSGWIYTDKLIVGDDNTYIKTNNNQVSLINDAMVMESGSPASYKLTLGNQNNVTLNTGKSLWDHTYGNYLSSTSGIELSTGKDISLISSGGDIKIYSTGYVNFSGIQADTILCKTFKTIGDNGIENPIYLGTVGSLVYKKDDFTPGTCDQFIVDSGNHLNFPGGERYSPVYVANTGQGQVITYTGVHYLENAVEIYNPVTMPKIKIGEDATFFKGSVLTHAGSGYATWEPAEYLKADGMLWNRYIKRPVLIYENRFVFDTEVENGDIDSTQAEIEFGFSDTIALVNRQTREKAYTKPADQSLNVIDNDGETISINSQTVTTDDKGLGVSFCPVSPWGLIDGCLPVSGYAYAVNKGGYLTMQLDPSATSGFSCEAGAVVNDGNGYSFKPSTLNTISIRPYTSTAFNLLAEDIDFAVYGAHTTKYHRYDSGIFGLDSNGLPSGLTPAFKIDAINYNAVSGNPQSGVYFSGYLDQGHTHPTGYKLDETGKVCINTKTPYVIASIPSGTGTLDVLSDLTVKGYTYSSGVITTELFVRPVPNLDGSGKFVVNAPLTVNSYGQIISQVPATAPTVPGSPTEVYGESGNGSVTLSWIAPTNNGGRNITNYIIEYSLNGGNTWTTYSKPASIELSTLISGLTNGVDYTFRVSAVNPVGTGAPSVASSAVMPVATKPSNPRNLVATKNNLSRTLSWDAPSLSGSSAILAYQIDYSDNYGATWTTANSNISSTLRTYTISGLDNEPTFYIRIKAINSVGAGAYAQAISIGDDPYTPPDDPTGDGDVWDFGKILFTGVCT